MIVNIVKFVLVVLFVAEIDASADQKDDFVYLPICTRNNPELNECIKNATIELKDRIVKGIPELNMKPLEPLEIPSVKLEQATKSLTFKAVLMDVKLHGLSNYKFTDVQVDLENLTMYAQIYFEHVYMDSEYMLMGEFQMLPVEGSGKVMVNFTDSMIEIKLKGGLIKRKDKFHFMNHETDVHIDIGKYDAKFDDMYSGSSDKSHISEHVINMHSAEIIKELQPSIETVVSMLFDDVANKFFRNISFDKLFPEESSS